MLHATSQLYTHTVAQGTSPTDLGNDATEEEKGKSGWFKWRNSALELYGVNYRYSSVITETRHPASLHHRDDLLAHAYSGYEGRGSLVAGDRAPEAPGLTSLQGETTVFHLLKPSLHTIFVFGSHSAELEGGLRSAYDGIAQVFFVDRRTMSSLQPGANSVLVDVDGHAHDSYMIKGDSTFVVIRPDTFIGAIVDHPDDVRSYFNGIIQ
jgi:hypothetical protein